MEDNKIINIIRSYGTLDDRSREELYTILSNLNREMWDNKLTIQELKDIDIALKTISDYELSRRVNENLFRGLKYRIEKQGGRRRKSRRLRKRRNRRRTSRR